MNGAASAAIAIETILGDGPTLKGSVADLVTRLAVLLAADGTLKSTGFSGLTTDYGLLATSASVMAVRNIMPIGSMTAYGGAAAPTHWLLCDGSAVSRTTYAKLFTAIDEAYGVGDGATTFNLPDMRGRVPMGVDGAAARVTAASTNGANADTLGGAGGTETHTLTDAQVPVMDITALDAIGGALTRVTSQTNALSTTTINNAVNPGGGAAHSNTQPWQTVNWIIFAGV